MTDPVAERAEVEAAQAGNRASLELLLRRHQPQIHAVCRRITGNDTDALDATQEALIAIVRGLPRFDGRSKFSTWVYRVTTNVCLDELRRRKRRPTPIETGSPEGGNDRSDTTSVGVDRVGDAVSSRLLVDQALAGLAPEFRAAVVLRDICQLDYAEIAEVLDVPIGTVRSRIARGRGQLADAIDHAQPGNSTTPTVRPTTAP
ncbi:MAG: sigma-70 family RNA polymerase sigma factor [Acidimicrobiales bacterium]